MSGQCCTSTQLEGLVLSLEMVVGVNWWGLDWHGLLVQTQMPELVSHMAAWL